MHGTSENEGIRSWRTTRWEQLGTRVRKTDQQVVVDQAAVADQAGMPEGPVSEESQATPGDMLRALPAEAQKRGTRLVSAQAMQARLFSVYDAAAAAEDALALVQRQLTVTLDRGYYEADEIEHLAAELDSLLTLEASTLRAGRRWAGPRRVSAIAVVGTFGGQTRSLRVAMMSTGRWSPSGTGMACRWVTPAWRKPAMRSAT